MSRFNSAQGHQPPSASVADQPGSGAFTGRIMAAIDREPAPTPVRAFLSAVHRRSARNAASALSVAWHLGTVRSWKIAPAVRVRSMALVLAVACALATGSLAAAATIRIVAEPVGQFFQSGVDEQGPVENQGQGVDGQHDVPGTNPDVKAPSNKDNGGQSGPSGTDEPGSKNGGQSGPSGTDEPGSKNGGQSGPAGTDEPGNKNGGQSGPAGTDEPGNNAGGPHGRSGTDQPGSNDGGVNGGSNP